MGPWARQTLRQAAGTRHAACLKVWAGVGRGRRSVHARRIASPGQSGRPLVHEGTTGQFCGACCWSADPWDALRSASLS